MITKLWCAGILCPYPELKRIHFSCPYCRWRRSWYGKFTEPSYWIDYTIPWKCKRFALIYKGKIVAFKDEWQTIKIDPRGHFTMLRCSIIVALDKIMKRFRWTMKPLMEFCEFLANYPTW